jgi:hypothetical protein
MRTAVCVAALVTAALVASVGRADEEKVPLDRLPKAVADAVKKRFPRLDAKEATKEVTEDKKTVYEVTVTEGRKKIDVTLTPEGVIVMVEKEIDRNDLPEAVAAAIDAKYPDAAYKICEEIMPVKDGEEKLESYEVLLETKDKKLVEVVVSPEGKITKTEEKKPDDK